ncbi:hypothetical protein QE152_g12778 [Popillia japonica]|uniref:Uncharacterized protein n=1 Tax=Popillia japonica TaxID=7064 RepID=A0AAW1LQJ1_POPJA
MPPVVSCSCCKATTDEHKSVICSICKKTFNRVCVDLSITEIRALRSKRGLTGTCSNCSALGSDVAELKSVIAALMNQVSELKQQTVLITNELSELKQQAPVCNNFQLDGESFENIIKEIDDRRRRKCNIIMYGIEEAPSRNRTERSSNDKEVAKKILTHLTVDCGFTTSRLGIFDKSRSRARPLRLTLEGEQHVHGAFRKAKTLGNKGGIRAS